MSIYLLSKTLSITSRAKRDETVAGPPPISMPTSIASRTSLSEAPDSAACSICHCIHDSQSITTEIPTAISSLCFWREFHQNKLPFPYRGKLDKLWNRETIIWNEQAYVLSIILSISPLTTSLKIIIYTSFPYF